MSLARLRRRFHRRRYRRANRRVPDVSLDLDTVTARGFYGQCGQDVFLVEDVFGRQRDGVFVDVGAHDGIRFSNTYYLERHLGWQGLAIEPLPEVYEALRRNRRCDTVQGCVANAAGEVRFLAITGYGTMLSGIVDEYDPRHVARIDRELADRDSRRDIITVPAYTLAELLEEHGLTRVDYLSIDVEGPELKILESIPFDRFDIRVISVENNYQDLRLRRVLRRAGYTLIARAGPDEFYRRG